MSTPSFRIELADPSHLEDLTNLVQLIEAEDHPDEPAVAANAPAGVSKSHAHFDWLASDCIWTLLAYVGDQPVGMALNTRVPKLDARLGFLYLDELHVIEPCRRRGIAKALLERGFELADKLGLAGVRLLTRPSNSPARALYESVAFRGQESMLYLFQFEHSEPQT